MEFTFKHWKFVESESHYNCNVFQDDDNRKFRVETNDDFNDGAVYEITNGKDEFVFTIPDVFQTRIFDAEWNEEIHTVKVDDYLYT